jgi:sigma-B regulation protein RsbU (phosphoserine phosphatase)
MLLGVGAVFAFIVVRRRGQRLIDEKYYQTQFDYRRALSELSEALAAKLGMNDLAHGLVSTLADLMKVKDASVAFFRGEADCCCVESVGIATPDVTTLCLTHQEELRTVLGTISGAARVEYLPVSLRKELLSLGVHLVQPICSKDRLIGAIMIGEKLSETAFKDEDISFLNSAATQASVSIENAFLYEELAEKERMKHELEIARQIQLASLPQQQPLMPGLDIAGGSLPAMEVGGDFYDYLQAQNGSLTVIIGDVSGKGTSAALYMSKVQGILRSLFTFGLSPRELFVRANRLLCKDLEKRSFVTALGAEFDLRTKAVQIARAGHLPLYRFDAASGSVEKIVSPGIGLGLNDAEHPFALLEENTRPLRKGDKYVFVSDGITEAHNEQGEDFGEERLISLIERHQSAPSMQLRDLLFEEVKCFTAGAPQYDDQTVVCISVVE